MLWKLIIVMCTLQIYLKCGLCEYNDGYTRIKRAKYYSNVPMRFYKLPPVIQPIRGPYSATPPPGYLENHQNQIKSIISNKHKDGLSDDEFRTLLKHLSRQDFDRIVEIAAEKHRLSEHRVQPFEHNSNVNNMFNNQETEFDLSKLISPSNDELIPSVEYVLNNNQANINSYFGPEDTENQQFSLLNGYIQQQLNMDTSNQKRNTEFYKDNTIFTNGETMKEDELPRPQNLREENDYDVSYTNNVPTVVKASSYKLENFGNLPLMNHDNSKLELVNSYNVPHYTVTSSRNQIPFQPQSSSVSSIFSSSPSFTLQSASQIQPSLPKSAAAQQSDAHLKATKIWTHKSTGTAYTLHDDGTLSLERPIRSKRKF